MNKGLKITLITLCVLIGFILFLLVGIKVGEKIVFLDFYSNANIEFKMPGANDNLVQQGMVYNEDEDVFLIAGYMSDNSASRVYVVSRDGEVLHKVALKNADGSDYTGHTGGIKFYGNYVYITEGTGEKGYDGGLDVFPLDKILAGEESVTTLGRVKTYNNPAYCYIYNGYMMVGEFYHEEAYETADGHRFTTPAGDKNNALIMVFDIDGNTENFGISKEPVAIISTTGDVQGMEIIDNEQFVLSSSWSISKSKLRFYDLNKITKGENTSLYGLSLPTYHIDSSALVKTVEAPPMSEEIVYLDGKLFILNESACNKYIFGKLMSGNELYSYNVK